MDILDKKYYKIKEVAEILDIPASTLRFWEGKFTILKPHRSASGQRYYTPKDIEVIRMVHYLVKEKGLKLEAAQEVIHNNRSGVSRHYEAVARLHEIRNQLSALLGALNSRH